MAERKKFWMKAIHLFKSKEAIIASGISPWDVWECEKVDEGLVEIVGPLIPPEEKPPVCEPPPVKKCRKRRRRKKYMRLGDVGRD